MAHSYYNYFTEIEEYFVRKRGKHLLVSPLDWSLIESWKQLGIPLHVVFRGIDQAFQKHEARGSQKRINSIFYCQPSVIECFEEFRRARIGEAEIPKDEGESRGQKLLPAIQRLEEQLQTAAGRFPDREAISRVRLRLSELVAEVTGGRLPSLPAVEETLQTGDAILIEGARRRLDPDRLKEFEKDARRELKMYKKKVSPEMYVRIQDNYIKRRIREEFGLPELTLFFLS